MIGPGLFDGIDLGVGAMTARGAWIARHFLGNPIYVQNSTEAELGTRLSSKQVAQIPLYCRPVHESATALLWAWARDRQHRALDLHTKRRKMVQQDAVDA